MSAALRQWVAVIFAAGSAIFATAGEPMMRSNLVEAILSEDGARQAELIRGFARAGDPFVEQALTAWRGGSIYLFEADGAKIPFLLDGQTDADGKAKGLKILDGAALLDEAGKPLLFSAGELTAADTDARLRKVIKTTLDLFALGNVNPNMRRDAVIKLGQEQNPDYIPFLETALKTEKAPVVIKALHE